VSSAVDVVFSGSLMRYKSELDSSSRSFLIYALVVMVGCVCVGGGGGGTWRTMRP
jgi:hypothetical protein